ncbi:MAG: DUF3108 domain-containing protein [Myxococcales bacterium]|nr:DUF3108 domain-containing protein [Myxococcales bacterium]
MRALVPALAVLGLLGCGGAAGELLDPAEPTASGPEPIAAIHAGEKMRFEVRLAGVLAGEATFTTVEVDTRDGATTARLSSTLRSAGALALVKDVRDDATTVLDVDALRPRSTSSEVHAAPRDYAADTRFVGRTAEIDFRPTKGPPQHIVYDFGAQVPHDSHSAMATMRVWQDPPGATRTLWVLGGRRIWKLELTLRGTEVIGTYGGNQAALRIDGVASRAYANLTLDTRKPPRTFSLWMSDDADRVPFRVVAGTELGDVTIDLVDYVRP